MKIKGVLFAVAVAWAIVNVLGLGYALVLGEPGHAAVHGVLAAGFSTGAYYLRRGWGVKQPPVIESRPQIEALEDEISALRRALSEKQEGLDFAEQLLAKRAEKQPVDQQYAPRPTDEPTRPS